MAIKSVLVGLISEEHAPSEQVFAYGLDFAAHFKAHLTVGFCVPKIEINVTLPIAPVRGLVSGANSEREERAKSLADRYLKSAQLAGVTARSRLLHAGYVTARDQLVRAARVNDLTILQGSDGALSLEKDLAEECLFNSGRPIIAVPPDWSRRVALKKITVAWDGSAKAARAVGDAMLLLAAAEEVVVVCVSGDKPDKTIIPGTEIAEHLSRHCRSVALKEIAATNGDIGGALAKQCEAEGADLLVMGGYGHNRFREMILGGVTQSMLVHGPVPVFMAA
ncbi:MAG: universal stress protein [Rhizobiales bacterium]|nr:universal stress protein [Hyphomicrobiales bacterium]